MLLRSLVRGISRFLLLRQLKAESEGQRSGDGVGCRGKCGQEGTRMKRLGWGQGKCLGGTLPGLRAGEACSGTCGSLVFFPSANPGRALRGRALPLCPRLSRGI